MQFKTLAVLALAGTAFALPEPNAARAATTSSDDSAALASVYAILATVLPSSLLQLALTNQAAAATVINSEIEHSEATWFTQLPTPVQSYLEALGESQFGITATGAPTGAASAGTSAGTSSAFSGANSTFTSPTLSPTSSKTSSASGKATSSSSSGGASMPTGVIGAGFAGVVGLVGILAL